MVQDVKQSLADNGDKWREETGIEKEVQEARKCQNLTRSTAAFECISLSKRPHVV